jgi:hypothetical protein
MKPPVALGIFVTAMSVAGSATALSPCVAAADKGQDQRAAGKLVEARATLEACSVPSCNAVVRTDCERWIRELDRETPTVVVRVLDARGQAISDAVVTLDDARLTRFESRAIPTDPGSHVLRARAPSGDVVETKAVLVRGDRERVIELRVDNAAESPRAAAPPSEAAAAPSSDRARLPVASIALGSVGAAALATFGYLEWQGHNAYAALESGCGRTLSCTDADTDPVRAQFIGAGISLGISVVALGAATVLYFTGRGSKSPSTGVRVHGTRVSF